MPATLLSPVAQGLMRKRIASINEAPIAEGERRIAVDSPTRNTWLAEQVGGGFGKWGRDACRGRTAAGLGLCLPCAPAPLQGVGGEFPLGGGSKLAY